MSSIWLAGSAEAPITAAPITVAIGAAGAVPGSTALPASCWLDLVVVELSDIAGMAEVSMWLTYDEAGRQGITPQRTTYAVQVFTPADAGFGFCSWRIDAPFRGGALYAHLVTDAGTANAVAKLWAST